MAQEPQAEELDLRGLKCPLPALLARKRLERAAPGEVFAVLTDDPMAPIDVPHMCRQEGYEVLALETGADGARMVLRRPANTPA
ncbi:MAG TPA: sulfurtransferase TusA family protein [Rhizomicrobium sp.]|jgi:tRNA 2-thiouridine synthesizing protein A|nr:sulfurtransferase TusA family protein [Rhizomicrobium sp.]